MDRRGWQTEVRDRGKSRSQRMTAVTSLRKQAEVTLSQAAQKSRWPDGVVPVPHTDTGRLGEHPQGGRANLCQGTRQINPVPSEEGVP